MELGELKTAYKLPNHIAFIIDGNGRWAKRKALPRAEGHKRGIKALEDFITQADELGVKYLTLFAFSSENWKRPKSEVDTLMNLLRKYLKQEYKKVQKNNIKYNFIGNLAKLPPRYKRANRRINLRGEINVWKDYIFN